ncbi:hypothetical protein LX86_009452 [Lentzea aerocolonigenes]|nr:hypothetical protein [Lentzea aerocolonigenes]
MAFTEVLKGWKTHMRKMVTAIFAMVLLGMTVLLPNSVSAAPAGIGPMEATGCNGNVCMFLSTPSGGRVYIQAWARNTSFEGNFDLVGPGGLYRHGDTKRWYAGSHPNRQEWDVPAVVGKYCVSGWENGQRIGYPCLSIR